jgi:L-aminopeptidase/D-esterase-like protein
MKLDGSITDVPGIKVGHADNPHALTGCTVILCEEGAVAGVDQHGGAPGTRETDLLRPMHLVEKAHAVLLSGGSAFGLDAAGGVMRYLEENGIGVDTGVVRVPIVPAAILFDLDLGESVVLGAIFAVNAFGDVIDPETNQILAGARLKNEKTAGMKQTDYFANTLEIMRSQAGKENFKYFSSKNTVVGVLATNVELNVEQVNKLAQTAQDGLARVIRPAHTMFDGDTIFALSIGNIQLDANIVQAFAAEVAASAILNAVLHAEPAGGLPAASKFLDV